MRLSMTFLIAVLTACGSSGTPKELDQFAERACACKREDVACGTKVLGELRTYTSSNKADINHEVIKTGARIDECLAMTGVARVDVADVLGKAVN
jgi:hypothetical protein